MRDKDLTMEELYEEIVKLRGKVESLSDIIIDMTGGNPATDINNIISKFPDSIRLAVEVRIATMRQQVLKGECLSDSDYAWFYGLLLAMRSLREITCEEENKINNYLLQMDRNAILISGLIKSKNSETD